MTSVLAASAPIKSFTGETSDFVFFETITNTFAKADPKCPDTVRLAFSVVSEQPSGFGTDLLLIFLVQFLEID
jgi:hypothetical protein